MDEDLTQEFMIIHKQMHNNKIIYDIDNNSDNLKINFKNIINLLNIDTKNRIHDISLSRIEFVDNLVDSFYKEILDELNELIDERNDFLNKNDINNSIDYITKKTNLQLEEFYNNKVNVFLEAVRDKYSNFTFKRIDNFFRVYNYDRLLNKVKDSLNNNNRVLLNTLKENIEIIEELNDNIKK